jgi:protein phosphatase
LKPEIYSISISGKLHPTNQDAFGHQIFDHKGWASVCDGVGSHKSSEFVSRKFIKLLNMNFGSDFDFKTIKFNLLRSLLEIYTFAQEFSSKKLTSKLISLLLFKQHSHEPPSATFTGIFYDKDKVKVANIGDSRVYRLRNRKLEQLTDDDSLIWSLYKDGIITKNDLLNQPQKNVLTRCIGGERIKDLEIKETNLAPYDSFLVTSDGLTDYVIDSVIEKICNSHKSNPLEMLKREALRNGSSDDITMVWLNFPLS